MKRSGAPSVLLALLAVPGLLGSALADPLHKFGNDGAWIHVDSGWQFPKDVAGFTRTAQPYNIDGNSDAGAEYRAASARLQAEVEIYAADSAATGARLDGAMADVIAKAGDARQVESQQAFEIDGLKDASNIKGVKIRYSGVGQAKLTPASNRTSADPLMNLYFFTTDGWRVKVLATAPDHGLGGDKALDAFVRALPWNTLGTESGVH